MYLFRTHKKKFGINSTNGEHNSLHFLVFDVLVRKLSVSPKMPTSFGEQFVRRSL